MRMVQDAEARTILRDLLKRHGPQTLLLCNLTVATFSLGLQDEALELANRAIRQDPKAVLPRRALCSALSYHDRTDGRVHVGGNAGLLRGAAADPATAAYQHRGA